MQVLSTYPMPPGCCAFCRGTSEPVIDTDMLSEDLMGPDFAPEIQGRVYICANCGNEVAQLLGALPAQAAQKLQNEREELRSEVGKLRIERDSLSKAVDALQKAGRTAPTEETANA